MKRTCEAPPQYPISRSDNSLAEPETIHPSHCTGRGRRKHKPHETMKTSLRSLPIIAVLATVFLSLPAGAATIIWSGASTPDLNWSTAGNWVGGVEPTNTDDVKFYDNGADPTVGNINNIVNSSRGVASLQYGNTNNFHTTSIAAGVTLTNTGNLVAGTETDNGGVALISTATITGAGGSLLMNGGGSSIIVRQGANGVTGAGATLDLSGLDTFIANISRVSIGDAGVNRSTGILILGKTNQITASGAVPAISLGLSGSNNGAGRPTQLSLGQTNAIFAGSIAVGRQKQTQTSIIFNPAFVAPVAYFRGVNGIDPVLTWTIGDGEANSGTTSCSGTANFTGGTVNAKVTTMTIGRASSNTGGTGNSRGTLTMDNGIIEANLLQVGIQTANTGKNGDGTVNVNGGTLSVIDTLQLGVATGGAGVATTKGRLNIINGGVVEANAIETGATSGGSPISITSGTLILTNTAGSASAQLSDLTMSDSTLFFATVSPTAIVNVTNLTTGGAGNTLQIGLLPSIVSYPATFRLIKYQGTILGSGFNFTMTGLPGAFTGSLVDNSAQSSVDLVITSGPVPQVVTWNGNLSGDWNTVTKNWKVGAVSTNYNGGDFASFNDTASGTTTVNLTAALFPGSVTVNNSALSYTFTGSGSIGGLGGLTKQGSGTLVLNNTAANSYQGDTTITGGTLQIGNGGTTGTLGSGSVSNNASLTFNRSDDITVGNDIGGNGSGTLTKSGAGIMTLSGANTFAGGVTISQGTLKAGTSAALGSTNGTTTINSGATLDIGANTINFGLERVSVSGDGVGGNGAIVNSSANGAFANANVALVTMTGNTRFGGTGRWDLRAAGGTTGDPTSAQLSTGGNGYTLTKVGTNTVNLVSLTVDPALGNIDLQSGTLGIEGNITSLGNPASTLTIHSNANWRLFQVTNLVNKIVVVQDGGIIENNNGVNTVIAPMTLSGVGVINAGGTSLTLSNVITGTGGFTKIGGSSLTLAGGPHTYLGNTVVSNGTLILNSTVSGGGTLTTLTNTTLGGNGNHTGNVSVGGALQPGGAVAYGTLTSGNLTLQPNATLTFDLNSVTTIGGGVNDLLQVNGNVTGNDNSITVNMLNGSLAAGSYRLMNYSGALVGTLNPIVTIAGGLSRYVFTLNTNTPGQVNLVVSGSPASLAWSGSAGTSWDINNTASWINQGTSLPDVFFQGDRVWLNDSASGFQLDIPAGVAVVPTLITNDSGNNYNINGPGKISGGASIVKTGGGILTISSTNDFSGTVLIASGVLNADNNSALGNTTGGTTVLNGGTLDVGSPLATADSTKNLGLEPITVTGSGYSGMGAIVNNATRQEINAVRVVTLAGNTTFGGNARWDIRGTGANLSTGGNAYNITKIGGAQVSLVATTVDPALGNIDIQQGTFSIETTTTGAGNPANSITVQSGATLQLFNLTPALNKVIVLNGDGSRGTVSNGSGANIIIGPVTLNGPVVINAGGTSLTLSNSVSGSGSLTKTSGGLLSLAGAVSYTGETVVGGGTLALMGTSSIASSSNITLATASSVIDVSARTDGKLTIGAGKSLIGFGTVRGSLAVSAGGTLSPGNEAVTLPISNLIVTNAVTLAGTNIMQTDKFNATNDLIGGAASIAFGGRLVISDINLVPYADGDMFKLFDASSYSGSFIIEPASPGTGLYWDQSQLTTSGILKVVSTPPAPTPPSITSVSRSGGNVVIAGSGGPANGTYYVITSTNLATSYSTWTSLATNTFDSSGNFSFPTPIDPAKKQQFYLLKLP